MGTPSTLPAGQGGRTGAHAGTRNSPPRGTPSTPMRGTLSTLLAPAGYSEYSRRTERHALSMDATASPPFARMSLRAMCSALTVPDPCTHHMYACSTRRVRMHHATCTHAARSTCTQAARGVCACSTQHVYAGSTRRVRMQHTACTHAARDVYAGSTRRVRTQHAARVRTQHAACTHAARITCTQAARGVYTRSTRQPTGAVLAGVLERYSLGTHYSTCRASASAVAPASFIAVASSHSAVTPTFVCRCNGSARVPATPPYCASTARVPYSVSTPEYPVLRSRAAPGAVEVPVDSP
jgi:hypothetical protein